MHGSRGSARRTRASTPDEDLDLRRFADLCRKASRSGLRSFSADEARAFPQLYRAAATRLAHAQTRGGDPAVVRALRAELARGHQILFRGLDHDPRPWIRRALAFLLAEGPRAIRAEWRALAAAFCVLYGLGFLSFALVARDLDLAWSLLDPRMVADEIRQLQATAAGQPFRGNFTFGLGESPVTAGWILAHNMGVAVLFFASGLVPPLFAYVLATNGLMVGTYTAVAGHWDQALAISSILWCHGTLEIQAFVLAGAAGLVLVRGLAFPGAWSRTHALRQGARRSWRLLAPVFPLLFVSGLIEGFVSPHAPPDVRLFVAVASGLLLLAWVLLGGRAGSAGSARAARGEPGGDGWPGGLGRRSIEHAHGPAGEPLQPRASLLEQ